MRVIELRRRGLLRLPDAIVAATALAADAHLLTLDERLARVFGDEVHVHEEPMLSPAIEPFDTLTDRLGAQFAEQMAKGAELVAVIRQKLGMMGYAV